MRQGQHDRARGETIIGSQRRLGVLGGPLPGKTPTHQAAHQPAPLILQVCNARGHNACSLRTLYPVELGSDGRPPLYAGTPTHTARFTCSAIGLARASEGEPGLLTGKALPIETLQLEQGPFPPRFAHMMVGSHRDEHNTIIKRVQNCNKIDLWLHTKTK